MGGIGGSKLGIADAWFSAPSRARPTDAEISVAIVRTGELGESFRAMAVASEASCSERYDASYDTIIISFDVSSYANTEALAALLDAVEAANAISRDQ